MLKEICIKDIKVKNPVFLAPMAGVTDLPYRNMVRKYGVSEFVYSEMISSRALLANSKKTNKKLFERYNEQNFAIQLAGSELEVLQEAAKVSEQAGASFIDINMGCPAKKVVRGVAGSALMKDLDLAGRVINALVKAVNIPITVKMRLGWNSSTINAKELAKIAENEGASLVSVHGRTREQFYSGSSNFKAVKEVKDNVNIPVFVNGDITNGEIAKKALLESGADGILVGRGSYGKPWVIKEILQELEGKTFTPPSLEERKNILLEHFAEMIDFYGQDLAVPMARKHLAWHTKGLHSSTTFRAKVNTQTDVKTIKSLVTQCFDNHADYIATKQS